MLLSALVLSQIEMYQWPWPLANAVDLWSFDVVFFLFQRNNDLTCDVHVFSLWVLFAILFECFLFCFEICFEFYFVVLNYLKTAFPV